MKPKVFANYSASSVKKKYALLRACHWPWWLIWNMPFLYSFPIIASKEPFHSYFFADSESLFLPPLGLHVKWLSLSLSLFFLWMDRLLPFKLASVRWWTALSHPNPRKAASSCPLLIGGTFVKVTHNFNHVKCVTVQKEKKYKREHK